MLQYPHKTVPRLYGKWIFLASSIFATQLFCSCAAFFIAFGGDLFESNVYERAAHFAAGAVHVAADGHFDGGQFAVQYRGQLLCGENQRGRHDGAVTGVSDSEFGQCCDDWLCHWHQCRDCVFSRRKAGAQGK